MAFKRSSLKNWIETTTVKLIGDDSVDIDVRIVSRKEGEKIVSQVNDVESVRGFVCALRGYEDDEGNELGLDGLIDDLEQGYLPPTVASAIAQSAINLQHTAALKN